MALTLEITMSLDGLVAGPNPSHEDPLGERGEELHEWAFGAQAWREAHGLSGGEANADSDVIDEQVRRGTSSGPGSWPRCGELSCGASLLRARPAAFRLRRRPDR